MKKGQEWKRDRDGKDIGMEETGIEKGLELKSDRDGKVIGGQRQGWKRYGNGKEIFTCEHFMFLIFTFFSIK